MPFNTQFSLSLELTRLVPFKSVTSKALESVVNLARSLEVRKGQLHFCQTLIRYQNTGSNIIVEADLAELFGLCRIAPNMDSSFRTIVSTPGALIDLCEVLVLDSATGPTVSRCLQKGQEEYFATVIQLSLLTAVRPSRSPLKVDIR